MSDRLNVAIDGPGGAGKSTVAKLLAAKLNVIYIDTGAMYRAVALKAVRLGLKPDDLEGIEAMLGDTGVDLRFEGGGQRVFLDGEDVSEAIRQHYVSEAASVFSAVTPVRHKLVALQRDIASLRDCVLDGRDIGSYVLPRARYKFFLTAELSVRAERRYRELKQRGQDTDLNTVTEDMRLRDERDSTRAMAPLIQADDAVLIDSTALTAEGAAEYMYKLIKSNN